MPGYAVEVGEFNGPLDLLLDLVERGRMEVTSISIAGITADYLTAISAMTDTGADEMAQFAYLGARLLYAKSQALLYEPAETDEPSEIDRIARDLNEYRIVKAAAKLLQSRAKTPSWPRQSALRLPKAELPTPNLSLDALQAAFARALRETQPSTGSGVIISQLTTKDLADRIMVRLSDGTFKLDELLATCQSRIEVVTAFLALLELVRKQVARVVQDSSFSTITIEAVSA